jgi:hypothetical protein
MNMFEKEAFRPRLQCCYSRILIFYRYQNKLAVFFNLFVAFHFTTLKLFNFEQVPYRKRLVSTYTDPGIKKAPDLEISFQSPWFSGVGLRYGTYLGLGGHLVLAERNDDLEVVPVVQLDVPAARLHQHLLHLPDYQFSSSVLRIRIWIRRFSESVSHKYESGYGSFHHRAKMVRKTLISPFSKLFISAE